MKFSPVYQQVLGCASEDDVFAYLCRTLNDSITYWDYFVNWAKVRKNTQHLDMDLNTLNYLVGKENIEEEFKALLRRHPTLVRLIPLLLACRTSDFKILVDFAEGDLQYEVFSFSKKPALSEQDIEKACRFATETGLLKMLSNRVIKSIPDYVIGVEVGLDSNGRKNRGGTAMETIVGNLLSSICKENGFDCITQASAASILDRWNLPVRVDKSNRRFDFAIQANHRLFLVETNYYGGGGSKLKATAGEYKSLHDFIAAQGHSLVWITDGMGWKTTVKPLEECFRHIDYTLNLKMVGAGLLQHILMGCL